MSHPEVSDIDQEDTSTMEESKLNTPDDEGPPERNLDIEEGKDAYRKGRFHPGYIGDIYNERYEVLCKIGYGRYSTVWLVKDLTQDEASDHHFKALKILSAEYYDEQQPLFEIEILKHLREADRSHPGYDSICHLHDDFEHIGPNGKHKCLVFDLIGETLRTFRIWFKHSALPNSIMRKLTGYLLMALDYAHDSGVIHTGSPPMEFDICLGDWGVSSWTTKHLSELIQPVCSRSPEVLIGAPWDWTTDWWNLGTTLLEVFRGVQMFVGRDSLHSPSMLKTHLEEIVDFFGPFPASLLEEGSPEIVLEIFNKDGTIKDSSPPNNLGLLSDNYMGDLPLEQREDFVDFLHALMKINPSERLPTNDLLCQAWIRGRQ